MKNLFKRKKDSSNSASASSSTSTLEISGPFNVRLEHHVDFDREFGLSGVPKDWDLSNIQGINYTVDDVNSEQQTIDRTMSEPVMVSTSNNSNNSNNSTSVATPSTSASSLFFNKLRHRNKSAHHSHQSLSTSPVNVLSTNSTPTLTPEINDPTSPTTPTSSTINTTSNTTGNSEFTISTNSVSTPHHDRQHSHSFFSKIFTKKNSTATPQPNEDSTVKNGQFVMGFTNMKKTQAGYYVEASQLENSNPNSKFKKDKLLIDLISPENPFRLFTKMKKIGTGSTADVYKAIHVPSGKKVAIKVMPLTSVKNTNFDMIENEIFMMKHACKTYNNIFEYDMNSDRTLMVQYFGTYMTVNNGIYEHIGRYLAASKRKNYHDSSATSKVNHSKQNTDKPIANNPYMQQQVINNSPAAKELENMAEHQRKSNDELWVTMEYVSGGKLTDLLRTRFMESEIAAILQPIMKGLHMLHLKYGVIHRDVKSDNVLITKDGKIKLADFGFCAENTGRRRSVVGTPYWMSPELVSGAEYDEKSDVWSLGILTLELADGEVPLIEHPPIKALFLIRSQDPPTFKSSSEWSDTFHDFLKRCLEKDPTKRATIDELLEHEFIKRACKLDFLAPLLTKIRAEKKKKNIKESDIGLQVIKLRTEEEEEEEEYQEQKKKKKGIGIMGLVTSFSEMQQSSRNADDNDGNDPDLGVDGDSGVNYDNVVDPDFIDDPDMYCGGGDYGYDDYGGGGGEEQPENDQQQDGYTAEEPNEYQDGDWNHEEAVVIDDTEQPAEEQYEHPEEENDNYGNDQYYDNNDEMLV